MCIGGGGNDIEFIPILFGSIKLLLLLLSLLGASGGRSLLLLLLLLLLLGSGCPVSFGLVSVKSNISKRAVAMKSMPSS